MELNHGINPLPHKAIITFCPSAFCLSAITILHHHSASLNHLPTITRPSPHSHPATRNIIRHNPTSRLSYPLSSSSIFFQISSPVFRDSSPTHHPFFQSHHPLFKTPLQTLLRHISETSNSSLVSRDSSPCFFRLSFRHAVFTPQI